MKFAKVGKYSNHYNIIVSQIFLKYLDILYVLVERKSILSRIKRGKNSIYPFPNTSKREWTNDTVMNKICITGIACQAFLKR